MRSLLASLVASPVVLLLSIAALTARAQAPAAPQATLSIPLPSDAPEGFDHARLLERVQVYVGSVATVSAPPARFTAELHWPQRAMTPLEVRVTDTAVDPPQTQALQVSSAQSWDELERLVALKLLSVLRVALAPPPQPSPPREPEAEPDPEPEPEAPDERSGVRSGPLLELGAGAATSSGFDEPRIAAGLRLAWANGPWTLGVASTLTLRRWESGAGDAVDVLETTWAASLRHEWPALPSRWLVQAGAEFGLFAARVAGERSGQDHIAYGLSPLATLLVLGGYRLSADGSVALLGGPAVDLLWTRSEITADAAPLYDSGHIRFRGELKLVLAF
jgi:hypothetical protein